MSNNNFNAKKTDKQSFQPEIKLSLDCLHTGGMLLFPTDYTWAMGCDATNAKALQRMLETSKMSKEKLVMLVDSFAKMEGFVNNLPSIAWDLNEVTEDPLNFRFDGVKFLDDVVLGSERTANFRISKEDFSKELCMRFKKPIAIFDLALNNIKVRNLADIDLETRSKVDYCVKYFEAKCRNKISGIKLNPNNVFEIIK